MDVRVTAIIQEIESQRNNALAQIAVMRGDIAVMTQQIQKMGAEIASLRGKVSDIEVAVQGGDVAPEPELD